MSTGSAPDGIAAALAELWTRRRPEVLMDLERLADLLEHLRSEPTSTSVIENAISLAHRLHGAFGVFGLTDQKRAMSDVETMLRSSSLTVDDVQSSISITSATVAALP